MTGDAARMAASAAPAHKANEAEAALSKADELRKLDVKFDRVNSPGRLATGMLRHLPVRAADPAWHHATGAQRFSRCIAATAFVFGRRALSAGATRA